jgi:hypothetical protein
MGAAISDTNRIRPHSSLRRRPILAFAAVFCLCLAWGNTRAAQQSAELVREHLYAGTLVAGEAVLSARVTADAGDREARFGLGLLIFARAVERFGQSLYRYGLTPPKTLSVPLLRFPVPVNPTPEPITYQTFQEILRAFDDDLASAEAVLKKIGDEDVGIVVDIARVRFDLRGNGKAAEDETLAYILAGLGSPPNEQRPAIASLEVRFDTGDAAWLVGYSHALMALCDFLLAHDFHATYDAAFHRFFPRSETPLASALAQPLPAESMGNMLPDSQIFADVIGLIHTINWPVTDPVRMRTARQHLKSMLAASRHSWSLILAESDDDREWLPNPKQTNVAIGQRVRQQHIDAWMAVLEEFDAILEGRVLVPHWRFTRGFDLKAFFDAPETFDLVMLLTGAGAVPYLRDGPMTSPERWGEITQAFEDNFFAYALWFN